MTTTTKNSPLPTINGTPVIGRKFAFEGCHKIYVCTTRDDEREARAAEYGLFPISDLPEVFEDSCGLKFISRWDLTDDYVRQGAGWDQDIVFSGFGKNDRTIPAWGDDEEDEDAGRDDEDDDEGDDDEDGA